ncbi:MAG TPA: hypothetical protein VF351_11135 [Actinomycetota bacterium]
MVITLYTETPGTDDRPEELPEGERPEELPQSPPQETPQTPQVEPGNVQPEVDPLTEPDSPEVGQPSPGPGPDEPSADRGVGMGEYLQRVEEAVAASNPRRTIGGWRERLRHREMHEPRERSTRVA